VRLKIIVSQACFGRGGFETRPYFLKPAPTIAMSNSFMQRWKPGATVKTHLLVAALLWSFIGAYLLVRGALLYGQGEALGLGETGLIWFWGPPLLALALGVLKARLLAGSAASNIRRILAMKNNLCLGAVYSLKMWALVALMLLAGRVLRNAGLADQWVALAYLAVGFALLLSSGLFWRQWQSCP